MSESGDIRHELREFIYLDDESINSHLSSLGVAKPIEVEERAGNEAENRSRFAGLLSLPPFSVGGEGEVRNLDTENTTQLMDATAPYRFQMLLEEVNHRDIEIKEVEEDEVSYGDLVRIQGDVFPLSLFKFQLAEEANQTLQNSTIKIIKAIMGMEDEASEELDGNEVTEDTAKASELFSEVAEEIMGNRVPIRIESSSHSFGALLNRDQMRVPMSHAFARKRQYTVFGRVEQEIDDNSNWDPLDTIRLMRNFSEEETGAEFGEEIRHSAESQGIEMEDDEIYISGPAIIIHPIAVFW